MLLKVVGNEREQVAEGTVKWSCGVFVVCAVVVRGLFGTSSGVGSQQGGCLFGCEAGRRATCAVVRWGFAKRELLGVTVRCAWGHVDTLCLWCARRWEGAVRYGRVM